MKAKAIKASQAQGKLAHLVLPEGEDERVIEGALKAAKEGFAEITLLGDKETISNKLTSMGGAVSDVQIIDPKHSELVEDFAQQYFDIRKGKIPDLDQAREEIVDPLKFAALMVHCGKADGTIGGAVHTTADTIRAAFQIIGRAEGVKSVSSFFLMGLNKELHGTDKTVIFGDCALIVDPDAEQLAEIAIASAQSFKAIIDEEPKIAMLSFSTKGSARHAAVTKVASATQLVMDQRPDLKIDGDMQFDAAFVEAVGASKAPESAVAGQANIFIFPSLDAGNIGYKIAQRIGGASATGPILQGLAKPANDLSRGCNSKDVFNMILTTINQVYAAKL